MAGSVEPFECSVSKDLAQAGHKSICIMRLVVINIKVLNHSRFSSFLLPKKGHLSNIFPGNRHLNHFCVSNLKTH